MEKQLTDSEITEKAFELSEQFNQYLFEHPEILDNIPDQAVLIFLDADDPAFNQANIELANKTPYPPDSQRIFIRLQKQIRVVQEVIWEADILTSPQLV